MKSVLGFVLMCLFASCVLDDSSDYSLHEEEQRREIRSCSKYGPNGSCCYACCFEDSDVCGANYTDRIGNYLGYEAQSNGACTGGGSGENQCAMFAQGLWTEQLRKSFINKWIVAARALQCASQEEGLFVFRNGGSVPPRETDILVYLNVGQNEPANCDDNLSRQDLDALYAHPGHVSVVSKIVKNNGLVTHLGLIEENLVISGHNGELCDDNLADATMRTVVVSFQNGRYSVDSGIPNFQVIGWIRHPLTGIYSDTGWHEGVISQAFRSVYERWDRNFVGWARDNGGTPFVHTRNGHILQDFVTTSGSGRALVYNPNSGTVFLVRDGFYNIYLGMQGATGLPLDEEHVGECLSVQNFENGSACWDGFRVTWSANGAASVDVPEPEPEPDPEPSPSESAPEDSGSDEPAQCYDNDWMPCYTGLISTQNIGLCQSGRTLCAGGRWQWNICDGEITPSAENCADGLDSDCDGLTDCDDPNCSGLEGCLSDIGGGDFQAAGEEEQNQVNCDVDSDGYTAVSCGGSDCDDRDSYQFPGSREECNGADDDCDGAIDEGVCLSDADNDGWLDSSDCAPDDPTVFPDAPESCNGRDDDCDGLIDENVRNRCNQCGGEPEERCGDNIDNDCDGVVDEVDVCPSNPDFDNDGTLDASDNCPDTYNLGQSDIDGDGVGDACDPHDDRVFPPRGELGAEPPEVCDGVDNDLDGLADDGYECVLNSWGDCVTECGSSGQHHCAGSCVWSSCFPPAEICWNGIDDDCDSYESEDCGAIAGAWCYGANLIGNSSFEGSLNGWTLEVRGNALAEMLEDCSTAQDGECNLRVVVSRQGAWNDVTLGTTLNLVSGTEYQIRLYTRKRDENVGDAPQVLISAVNGVENVGVWSQCATYDGWNQCAIRFRARDSASGYRLLILLGRIFGEVLLDDVRVLGCP